MSNKLVVAALLQSSKLGLWSANEWLWLTKETFGVTSLQD